MAGAGAGTVGVCDHFIAGRHSREFALPLGASGICAPLYVYVVGVFLSKEACEGHMERFSKKKDICMSGCNELAREIVRRFLEKRHIFRGLFSEKNTDNASSALIVCVCVCVRV